MISNKSQPREVSCGVPLSLSSRIWGVDWSLYFPVDISGTLCRHVSYDEFSEFVKENYAALFESERQNSCFLWLESSDIKDRYYRECVDFFLFYHNEKAIGTFASNLADWSSYYFRTMAILPEYEGRFMTANMVKHMIQILKDHGVHRVDADISPGNLVNIQNLTRLRFNITATQNSERWGALVRMTRFLNKTHRDVFLNQFCNGRKPQLKKDV